MQGLEDAAAGASLQDLDRRYSIHPFTSIRDHEVNGPLMMVEGRGCRLTDSAGKSYLDAMAGLWCVNIGYGNEEMAAALQAQTQAAGLLPLVLVHGERCLHPARRAAGVLGSGPHGPGVLRPERL